MPRSGAELRGGTIMYRQLCVPMILPLAALLLLASPGAAQVYGTMQSNPVQGPILMPGAGTDGPILIPRAGTIVSRTPDAIYGFYTPGYRWSSLSSMYPSTPPVFMTSLNYPGVYGAHSYGILPGLT